MPMGLATAQDLARLRPRLLRFAMLQLRDRSRAEGVVQDTLLAALENVHRFAGHMIAHALRAPRREEPLDVEYALVSAGRNLERLPEKSGRVFVLRYVLEMESQEICTMRECPDLQGLVADAL
jgi:DNA-directed RNA polymerase specialized sigma24 family protein